jgi:hypothetical protein
MTLHGLHDASTDPDTIAGWWMRWPTSNIGVATGAGSGLVVVDLDGQVGYDSILELQRAAGQALPDTAWVRTPSGGWHAYFRWPGEPVPNSASKLGPGVDVRGDGGYVVAPPSIGANGTGYRWAFRSAPAPLPAWLLERIRPRLIAPSPRPVVVAGGGSYGAAALRAEADEVAVTAAGSRNHRLFLAAARCGELVAAGLLSANDTVAALLAASLTAGLEEFEAERTIASGLRRGEAHPRAVAS